MPAIDPNACISLEISLELAWYEEAIAMLNLQVDF